MRKRKILVVASYINIGVTVTKFKEPTFSNPPTYKIEARPFLDDYKPTKVELEQLFDFFVFSEFRKLRAFSFFFVAKR